MRPEATCGLVMGGDGILTLNDPTHTRFLSQTALHALNSHPYLRLNSLSIAIRRTATTTSMTNFTENLRYTQAQSSTQVNESPLLKMAQYKFPNATQRVAFSCTMIAGR
jgi:hypothetical protein